MIVYNFDLTFVSAGSVKCRAASIRKHEALIR